MEEYLPSKAHLIMTRGQVRAIDSWAINEVGIPGVVLMENAGRSCAELIIEQLKNLAKPKVCIFCGTGNNGGDGYVIARHLVNHSFDVTVVVCGEPQRVKGDAKVNLDILRNLKHPIQQLDLSDERLCERVDAFCRGSDMVVDALFGTGLKGELRQDYCRLIESINRQGLAVLAVDIPSGLDCDTGELLGAAIKAKYTVTFVAVKKGFAANKKAAEYTGRLYVASIGVEPSAKSL